jgi:predicted GNAT family acetyltransferase
MAREVVHNAERNRFEMALDGGAMAVLDYRLSDGVMTLTHTGVPPEFEGRGIGGRLVQGALDQIRAQGLKIVVRCGFVDAFIDRHKEYADLKA